MLSIGSHFIHSCQAFWDHFIFFPNYLQSSEYIYITFTTFISFLLLLPESEMNDLGIASTRLKANRACVIVPCYRPDQNQSCLGAQGSACVLRLDQISR